MHVGNFDSSETEFDGADKRARDADREEVMSLLDGAMSDGQLDGVEHRERVAIALRASTLGELAGLVDDLQVASPTFPRLDDSAAEPAAIVPKTKPALPVREPTPPAEGASTNTTVKTVLGFVGAAVVVALFVGIASTVTRTSDSPNNSPFGGKPTATICDANGQNCKGEDGKPRPDLAPDRALAKPAPGPWRGRGSSETPWHRPMSAPPTSR